MSLFCFVLLGVIEVKIDAGQQEELDVYEGELASIKELDFAFKRAASRLVEISSKEYYEKWKRVRKVMQ